MISVVCLLTLVRILAGRKRGSSGRAAPRRAGGAAKTRAESDEHERIRDQSESRATVSRSHGPSWK
jgi:hypothetical protein